jgi:hypothetical protein
MSTDKIVWNTRRVVWLIGWIVVAVSAVSLLLVLWNTPAGP